MAEVASEHLDDGSWRSIFITAQDGLKLHVRDYPASGATNLPVVCLPGLARSGADFHELARLATDPHEAAARARLIVAAAGGRSDYDRDARK